jgi:hypothetical protein
MTSPSWPWLDAQTAFFEALTEREKLYAHYGGLIVLIQTSPEIYRLIHRINPTEDTASLKAAAFGLSEDDFKAYLAYL